MEKQNTPTQDPKLQFKSGIVKIIFDATLQWFDAQAHTDIPLALSALRDNISKAVSAVLNDNAELELPTESMNSYLEGRKGGELSKELAMISGMARIGLSKEQIDQVVEYSKHAWDSTEKEKSP